MNLQRIWAGLREVAWTSVFAVLTSVAAVASGFVMPDFLGVTIGLTGTAITFSILSMRD